MHMTLCSRRFHHLNTFENRSPLRMEACISLGRATGEGDEDGHCRCHYQFQVRFLFLDLLEFVSLLLFEPLPGDYPYSLPC